jgi:hypothetical protein
MGMAGTLYPVAAVLPVGLWPSALCQAACLAPLPNVTHFCLRSTAAPDVLADTLADAAGRWMGARVALALRSACARPLTGHRLADVLLRLYLYLSHTMSRLPLNSC